MCLSTLKPNHKQSEHIYCLMYVGQDFGPIRFDCCRCYPVHLNSSKQLVQWKPLAAWLTAQITSHKQPWALTAEGPDLQEGSGWFGKPIEPEKSGYTLPERTKETRRNNTYNLNMITQIAGLIKWKYARISFKKRFCVIMTTDLQDDTHFACSQRH